MSVFVHSIIVILILVTLAMTIVIYNKLNKPTFKSTKILKVPSCEECGSLTNENARKMCLEGCQLDRCYKECSGKKSRPECILQCVNSMNDDEIRKNVNYNLIK